MITRVRKYIRDHQMLKAEDMVVAGISGGADSIAMLHILKNLLLIFLYFPVFPTSISLVEALLKYLHIIILP